jgi:hypothetical protein
VTSLGDCVRDVDVDIVVVVLVFGSSPAFFNDIVRFALLEECVTNRRRRCVLLMLLTIVGCLCLDENEERK